MICSEVPFMYYSDRVQTRIGTFSCIFLGMVCYSIRLGAYSLLPKGHFSWLVLLIVSTSFQSSKHAFSIPLNVLIL